jgi:polyribonucleotide nucleotidyltransferase
MKNVRWLYLRVNILGVSDTEIATQIKDITRKKKQSSPIKEHLRALSLYDDPNGIKTAALKKYLKVYDLKKGGKSIKEIIEDIGNASEKKQSNDLNIQREYKRHFQKAKKIIANIERMDFPGKY